MKYTSKYKVLLACIALCLMNLENVSAQCGNTGCQVKAFQPCTAGMQYQSGVCMPQVQTICPTQTNFVNGACQYNTGASTCAQGATYINGGCQASCSGNTFAHSGTCAQCPLNTNYQSGQCVMTAVAPPVQPPIIQPQPPSPPIVVTGESTPTVINITNIANSTNTHNIVTNVNSTNINNINLGSHSQSGVNQSESAPVERNEPCCVISEPRRCEQEGDKYKCHQRRKHVCGDECYDEPIYETAPVAPRIPERVPIYIPSPPMVIRQPMPYPVMQPAPPPPPPVVVEKPVYIQRQVMVPQPYPQPVYIRQTQQVAVPQPIYVQQPVPVPQPIPVPQPVYVQQPVAVPQPVYIPQRIAVPQPIYVQPQIQRVQIQPQQYYIPQPAPIIQAQGCGFPFMNCGQQGVTGCSYNCRQKRSIKK